MIFDCAGSSQPLWRTAPPIPTPGPDIWSWQGLSVNLTPNHGGMRRYVICMWCMPYSADLNLRTMLRRWINLDIFSHMFKQQVDLLTTRGVARLFLELRCQCSPHFSTDHRKQVNCAPQDVSKNKMLVKVSLNVHCLEYHHWHQHGFLVFARPLFHSTCYRLLSAASICAEMFRCLWSPGMVRLFISHPLPSDALIFCPPLPTEHLLSPPG